MGENLEQRRTALCPECGDEKPITQTVPWQPNICSVCGSDVPNSND